MMNEAQIRLFFAALPLPDTAAVLEHLARDLGLSSHGRALSKHSLHMTLAFLGGVAISRQPDLLAIGQRMQQLPACALDLRHLCLFNDSTLCLESDFTPDALLSLQYRLISELNGAGFSLTDSRFRPHVTLVRRAKLPRDWSSRQDPPIHFELGNLALLSSELHPQGARYHVITRWPLSPTATNPGCFT
jgi:2'-5' RNA ligase